MNAEPQSADTMNARRHGWLGASDAILPRETQTARTARAFALLAPRTGSAALPLVRDARVPGFARRTRAGGARYEAVPEAPARLAVE